MAMIRSRPNKNKSEELRTLYECEHARVRGPRIVCEKGHPISTKTGDPFLETDLLAIGRRLGMSFCQTCPDFSSMGPRVAEDEKGWVDRELPDGNDDR